MQNGRKSLAQDSVLRRYEVGIRVALEEMMTGLDYARVEDILRALANNGPPEAGQNTVQRPDQGV